MKPFLLSIFTILLISCRPATEQATAPVSNVAHPKWTQSAVIYEVNVRQYTPEGTFKALEAHLSRLQALGVNVLWFMPIHPIGVEARKGSLGSYYAVQDYTAVNPEFGNLEDFKSLVAKAHDLGFRVIIDWVANHTSRDAKWVREHPDWYLRDSSGTIIAPFDWTDVAKLDFNNQDMRAQMLRSMQFWVDSTGIDGFRCDVAAEVPADFWDHSLAALRASRSDLFFLAEAEAPDLMVNAFDAYYAWSVHACMNALAQGRVKADSLVRLLSKQALRFPEGSMPMYFTSNHDENSWNGTEFERMGAAVRPMAVLSFMLSGIPLIYSGQEAGFNRRLEFFEKDQIDWSDPQGFSDFYRQLVSLRARHPALWAPAFGAPLTILEHSAPAEVLAIQRTVEQDKVLVLFNLSNKSLSVKLKNTTTNTTIGGTFTSVFGGETIDISPETEYTLGPWGYIVYTR